MRTELRQAGRRWLLLLALAAFYVGLGSVLRFVLWWKFGAPVSVTTRQLTWILPAGLAGDALQAVYLLVPVGLLLWWLPDRWWQSRGNQWLRHGMAMAWVATLIFLACAEYFFFEEFSARFNLVAVDYLVYPTEVIGDIRAEYPVMPLLAGATVVAIVLVLAWRRLETSLSRPAATTWRARGALALAAALVLTVAAFSMRADSFVRSSDRVAAQLAMNGAATFFEALRTSEIDYHAYYASRQSRQNLSDLRRYRQALRDAGIVTTDAGLIERDVDSRPDGLGRLNVVVLVCESFGAEFSRLLGSQRDWTPNFDQLAQQGLWFSQAYATGTRTVRGLEAIAASFPPIPTVSILHRNGNEGIATWGAVMQRHGYRTSFLYGGYGDFDGMNHFFGSNGFQVLDRTAIEGSTRFENIWGVSDEDLYDLSLRHFDTEAAAQRPFFAIVMNTSNHKPFTFRAGVPGVQEEGGGRESGVRYEDFALGYFMREARRHSWFDNTLFVIVADHGARVYGHAEIPIESYRIPLLIYAPGRMAPRQVREPVSQIDIAPTVLGLLGLSYRAPFFGIDALRAPAAGRVVLLSHNHDVAALRGDELVVLGLHKSVHDLWLRGAPPRLARSDLATLAIATYQTAFEWFRGGRYRLDPP